MDGLEIVGIALGAILIIACAALIFWPSALGVAGVLLIVVSLDRGKP